MTSPDQIREDAAGQLGSPYIYGTWGKKVCSVALRKQYAGYNPSQAAITFKRCQQLRPKSPVKTCDGCRFKGRLAFDCRGFTHWLLERVGITIAGQSVGTQWNTKANWAERGDVAAMPDLVCCVFVKTSAGKWKHTGMHLGGGQIIHCGGGEVQRDTLGGKNAWTHYAIPAGLYTDEQIKQAHKERGVFMRTLKIGDRGEDVKAMQEMLAAMGYDVGAKNGKSDGIFGPKTETAVKAFQNRNGLPVTGIADKSTLDVIAARAADPTQPELPEDDDQDGGMEGYVLIDYTTALEITRHLQTALDSLKKLIGDAKP